MNRSELHSAFPDFGPELQEALLQAGISRTIPRNTVIYEEGFPCEMVPFLIKGQVRVYKIAETGREITLYRVQSGQTCVLSSSCGLSGTNYPAIAEAEEEVELLAVPVREYTRLTSHYPELQRFVNRTLSERLAELMLVVEEVAFRRVDLRLAEHLVESCSTSDEDHLTITHAQLAVELGTAREVVSRILKDFERQGMVRLGRGEIFVTDTAGLARYRDTLDGRRT